MTNWFKSAIDSFADSEVRRIAHGLKRLEAESLKAPHERITLAEIMANVSGPAEILFKTDTAEVSEPDMPVRKIGGSEWL